MKALLNVLVVFGLIAVPAIANEAAKPTTTEKVEAAVEKTVEEATTATKDAAATAKKAAKKATKAVKTEGAKAKTAVEGAAEEVKEKM